MRIGVLNTRVCEEVLKKYILNKISKVNKANKELRITRYFASKRFILPLGIAIFLMATIITNIGVNTIDNALKAISTQRFKGFSLMDFIKINFKYIYVYLIVYFFSLCAYIKLAFNIIASYKDIKNGQKGSSRFATNEEVKEQYKSIPDKDEEFEGDGGIPIYREENKIFIDDSNVNNLILGITRSGKGEVFVLPMIDIFSRSKGKPSLVFGDPKGELTKLSHKMLKDRGYEVKVFNLLDLDNTSCYNPLQLIIDAYKNNDLGEAQLLAKSFTFALYNNPNSKEPMWENSAMSLVSALILAICEKCLRKNKELPGLSNGESEEVKKEEAKVTLYTVGTLLSELGSTNTPAGNALDLYFDALPKHSIAKGEYATSKFSEGKTRSSIFTVAMGKLNIFTLEKVAKFTAKNDIDLYSVGFGEKPVAVFLIAPDYDKSLHALNTIFINQLYYVLAKESSFSITGKCTRKVKIILDEFGNMTPLDNIETIMTVCLGRNIEFTFLIQAYSQLKGKYGEDVGKIIEDNCGNQVFLMTGSDDTAEKFSKLIGEKTITVNSRSGGVLSIEKSQTESLDKRRLLDSAELRKLKEGELVVVRSMKRTNLNGEKIVPHPIFACGENSMVYRYKYLKGNFEENIKIKDIIINSSHRNIKLENLRINLDEEVAELMHKKYVKMIEENAKYQQISNVIMAKMNAEKKVKEQKESTIEEKESFNEVSIVNQELIQKLKSSTIIKGSLNQDEFGKLDLVGTMEDLYELIEEYCEVKPHLKNEFEKILTKEGYSECAKGN